MRLRNCLLLLFITISLIANAQKPLSEYRAKRLTRFMVKKLRLSSEQKLQIATINSVTATRKKEIQSKKDINKEELQKELIELNKNRERNYAQVLTPDQLKNYNVHRNQKLRKKKNKNIRTRF